MKKYFVLLFGLIILILIGGCQNLVGIFPFLNKAPVIISEPVITATENNQYSYQLEVNDPEGDSLTYYLVLSPDGMNINGENGLIIWTPTNEQVGIHQIIIEISDGKQSVTQGFEIEVINVNNPPQIFSYFPTNLNFKINEGNSVKFEVQAYDIDLNTNLSYQWLLNGKKVSSSTGSGDGSKSSWIYSASYGDYSQKIVKILVTDGELEDCVRWNITINDTTPPAQPTLNTVSSPTNISPQILSGTKEANTSIWINGLEVVPINPITTWSYSFNLSEGENNISITSQDSAGNESDEATVKIILDTIFPAAPSLHRVITPTSISTQTLSGTKESNTSIWINGVEVVPLDPSVNWSYSYNLSEGINDISITSWNAAGNESTPITIAIILDTSAPEAPTLDTITSPTNVSPQILSGNKETNSSIWINGTEVISINSDIAWSYTFDLFEGNNKISIISRDASGNESTAVTIDIVLDTIVPETPTLNAVSSPTNILPQILSGAKEINTSVWINGTEVVSLDSSVNWLYSYNLSEGTNNISVTSRDAADNESSAITAIIEYDPNIYVNAANATGTEDGTETHPFNTIAEGIDAVAPGKSVMVAAGTYNEQLIINKGITLQGAGKESTSITILVEYIGNLITVTADDVTISGFNIDGKSNADIGIYSDSSSSIEISENIIQNQKDSGILYHSAVNDYFSGIHVYNNEIYSNSKNGIKVTGEGSGIIESNAITKNTNGIRTNNSASLEIKHNNINDNIGAGIICQDSSFLLIWGNEITINDYGIKIGVLSSDTTNPDIGGGTKNGVGQNKIVGNKTHGVSNKTAYNIMAKNNWWGNEDGPKYPGNTSSSGDWAFWSETDSEIIFTPHLSTEP